MTLLFFVLIPILMLVSAIVMYSYNGRRQLMQFDLVQFLYAFLISPVIFLWSKSFLFVILQRELNINLSLTELFIVDTVFSLIFLFIFAFVVIHSLTKTFHLHQQIDPVYDMFEHSEFFHQEFSHLGIYAGSMLILTLMSGANLFVPFVVYPDKLPFYFILFASVVGGILGFSGFWMYESGSVLFMRIIKLFAGAAFLLHTALYFLIDPDFNLRFGLYWAVFTLFLVIVALSLFAERPDERDRLLNLPFQLNLYKPNYYWRYLRTKLFHLLGY